MKDEKDKALAHVADTVGDTDDDADDIAIDGNTDTPTPLQESKPSPYTCRPRLACKVS